MTVTSILVGGIAVIGGSCALVGGVAVLATRVHRPRTARALADQSARADRIAEAIMNGERDARDAEDKLALAAGCVQALRHLLPADPIECFAWWDKGLAALANVSPADPGTKDPLRLAACLQYCVDLAYDELHAAGRGTEASRRARMGSLLMSGFLDQIDGWTHLQQHRTAGIRELAGETFAPMQGCPFCGFAGTYDQTWLRCDLCATLGELNRTVPSAPLPRRIAPDLCLATARASGIEARAMAGLHVDSGSR
jgi:hypothetical protein